MSCFAWITDDEDESDATEYNTDDAAWAAEQCAKFSSGDFNWETNVSVRCSDGVVRAYLVSAEPEISYSVRLIQATE